MKTYSEKQHRNPINWNKFLARETFNERVLRRAYDLASQWVTCACGNQCASIPRRPNGQPKDDQLHHLGLSFDFDIGHLHDLHVGIFDYGRYRENAGISFSDKKEAIFYFKESAHSTLKAIEERSTFLMKAKAIMEEKHKSVGESC